MLKEQIIARHKVFTYRRKPDTKTAYLLEHGEANFFPNYISYDRKEFAAIANKGRARVEKKVADLKTTFRSKERSPYKVEKPYVFSSSIWQNPDFPLFVGYGDIGRTGFSGKTEPTKDLIIIYTSDNKEEVEIHLFAGLLESKEEVFNYLVEYVKQKKP